MVSNDQQDKRLDRIEEKIDKLSDAMISIARAEEKLVSMEQKYSAQYERMNKFSTKLDEIEAQVRDNNKVTLIINKLFWGVIAAVLIGLATQYFMVN